MMRSFEREVSSFGDGRRLRTACGLVLSSIGGASWMWDRVRLEERRD